ncbi:NAD(P)/FAD-dependent oxidoreductase [Amycolatopsis sp. EV170708-02-1]|uniref:flavin-containing monooxygenase n=1 Tax=Amycolatopsis sp. EV170708-02-1 TaxID=2919322 RepID=UPI001F0C678F|nr:NAD(P)/FAD-dependent oxidoreductase [Amycolatopsis sp. EV170708-02-1]UMP06696.1 NAD(P)/FAD-dependent oxidoreductase [Amycolatopsis sp. EV170708-02-1]
MTTRTEALIVGAGLSGIGQAVALTRSGIDFVVLEKAPDLGGTWRANTYPGATCDVEAHLYSYSHTKNPYWRSTYAGQEEILGYLRGVADRHGLLPRIRFGTQVTSARWDEATAEWTVKTGDGATYVSRFLILGVGGLHVPRIPDVPGAATFQGSTWHTSCWNHDIDLAGKHVTLVGVGASGVQVAPHLAERAASLTIFQRTAPWVLPKADAAIPAWRQRLFAWLPAARSLHRLGIYLQREKRGFGFHTRPELLRVAEPIVQRRIAEQITDPSLRVLVTPDYPLGCKRVLFSTGYYATLNRPDVHVVPGGPAELRPDTIVDTAGGEHRTDVLVYATGFDLTGSFDRIEIAGLGGRLLKEAWRDGMHGYHGLAVPDFPNMFTLLGPNGFAPYTSVVPNIETQARYVVQAIRTTRSTGARALTVRHDATDRFLAETRTRFARTVWAPGNCRNWYQNASPSGTVLWPDSILRYRLRLRRLRRTDYDFLPAQESVRSGSESSSPG